MNKLYFPFIFIIFLLISLRTDMLSQDFPATGYIQHMTVDYSEPNIVYSATIGQGLLKSTDYGESWNLICDKASKNEFHVIKVDPKNPSILLAGGSQSGILLSIDKGATWKQIGLKEESICDISIDETNPKRVFVLTDKGVFYNNNIDNPADWVLSFNYVKYVNELTNTNRKRPQWGYSRFQKIAINPHNPNTIIVAARWEGGFHRSDDGGKTWKHESVSGIYRRVDVIYFHPTDPNIICVGTHHQGLFKSYNNGKSWVPHSDGLRSQIRLPYYGAYLISGFTADKNNPDIYYTGADYSSWKSTDGGLNWNEMDRSLTCEFVRTMAVDPKNPNKVYAGSNIGMYKSTNAGNSWQSINVGLRKAEIKKNFSIKTDTSEIEYALSENYPFVFRKSGGEKWKSFSWLLAEYGAKSAKDLFFDNQSNQLVLVTDKGNYTSNDYGYRWHGKDTDLEFAKVKSEVVEKPAIANPDLANNYEVKINLTGDVFFNHMLVDSLYRKPPYISIQIVEEGYPFNGSVPAWSTNIDDNLIATLLIPKSTIDQSKKYIIYAEVRDFQKNYKTGYNKISFIDNTLIPISIGLKEGFCLKKVK
jgi:photosystem II stability/assembly factor-like uncharacterized protein